MNTHWHVPRRLLLATALAAAVTTYAPAHADSFASSASSAGSASSGSVSTSLNGSSNSSTRNDRVAAGAYRIDRVERLAGTPDGAAMVRMAMQAVQTEPADSAGQPLTLDLPAAVFDREHLARGDLVDVQRRAYGFQFAHNDTRAAFFLVLADDWHDELAARPVAL